MTYEMNESRYRALANYMRERASMAPNEATAAAWRDFARVYEDLAVACAKPIRG